MSGQGEVRAAPDTVMLSAGVSAQAPTAAAALAANSSRMQAVIAALKKQGVPDKDIQTSNFSVSPQYANGNGDSRRASPAIRSTIRCGCGWTMSSKLGATLDALVTAGANQMNGINFSITRCRAAAGTGARRGGGRCRGQGRDLCQGGGREPGADPVHQRKRQ